MYIQIILPGLCFSSLKTKCVYRGEYSIEKNIIPTTVCTGQTLGSHSAFFFLLFRLWLLSLPTTSNGQWQRQLSQAVHSIHLPVRRVAEVVIGSPDTPSVRRTPDYAFDGAEQRHEYIRVVVRSLVLRKRENQQQTKNKQGQMQQGQYEKNIL